MANTTDYTRLLDGYALLAIKAYIANNYAAKSHTHTKSQITDFPSSMPASDVYAWAKAATKPSYTLDEIGDGSTRKLSNYLTKITYEWNKDISFGSSGYLKIGSFQMYDSNVTINIDATTDQTFHGTVVIASQNTTASSIGSVHIVRVYDDPSGTIANSLRIVWTNGSRNYDVYFVPQAWSKNIIHIRANGIYGATDICISQTGTPPSTTSGLEPVNVLTTTFALLNHNHDSVYLGKTATAADSSKLNGQAASYYLNYNNLTNKPTIPTVSDATITIKQTGLSDQTFTLNGSATTITLADTNTWRPLGTGASDACAGNDSRLSDARPASDVYDWAKASTKPSYTHNEIGAGVLTIGDGANRLMFRTNASYANGIYYSTPGNEALVFATKYSVTSWIFATTDPTQQSAWTGLTPSLQIKNGRVTINKLIAGGTDAAYNLDVNGTLNATTIYENGNALAAVATSGSYNDLSNTPTIPTKSSWNYDDRYVKLTETQTISGVKTFDSVIQAAAGINIGNTNSVKPIVMNSSTSGNKFVRLYPTTNNSSNFDIYLPAAAGTLALVGDNNHSHTLSIASGGTASINLAANTTYTLTAGGKTYAFKTPPAGSSGYYANQYNSTYYLSSNSDAMLFSEDIQSGVAIIGLDGGNALTISMGWGYLASNLPKRSLLFSGNRVDLTLTDQYQYYFKGLSIDMYDDDYYTLHIRANDYSDLLGTINTENIAAVKLHALSFEYEPYSVNSAVTYKKYVEIGVVMHNINYTYSSSILLKMNIRGNSSTDSAITSYSGLCGLLYYAGHRSAATCLTCSGRYSSNSMIVLGVYASAYNSGLYLVYCSATSNTVSTIQIANGTVTDTISVSLVP